VTYPTISIPLDRRHPGTLPRLCSALASNLEQLVVLLSAPRLLDGPSELPARVEDDHARFAHRYANS
jgi:hypothetical protein